MRVTATTDAPRDTAADTVVVGVFDGEDIAHDVEGGAPGACSTPARPSAAFRHLAVAHADGRAGCSSGSASATRSTPSARRVAAAAAHGRARRARDAGAVLGAAAPRRRRRRRRRSSRARCWPRTASTASSDGRGRRAAHRRADHLRPPRRRRPPSRAPRSSRRRPNAARDLQNTPANDMTPRALAERARTLEGARDVEVDGARRPGRARDGRVRRGRPGHPRRARADHAALRPAAGAGAPVLGLVGKAVTFDTGGISIKPAGEDARDEVRHVGRRGGRSRPSARSPGSGCRCASSPWSARRRTCQRASAMQARRHRARDRTARRSRSTTPTPRAASCSPTASPTRSSSAPSGSSTSPRSPARIVTALGGDLRRRDGQRRRLVRPTVAAAGARDAASASGGCRWTRVRRRDQGPVRRHRQRRRATARRGPITAAAFLRALRRRGAVGAPRHRRAS